MTSPEEYVEPDYKVVLGKPATSLQRRMAEWLMSDEVGYDPNSAKSKREAFAEGVRMAVAHRMNYQASEHNRSATAEEKAERQREKEAAAAERAAARSAQPAPAAEETAPAPKPTKAPGRKAAKAAPAPAAAPAAPPAATRPAARRAPARRAPANAAPAATEAPF